MLTNHYERCGRYYGSGGWGSHGTATEEERRLTMMLFSGIFDSLAQRVRLAIQIWCLLRGTAGNPFQSEEVELA